jgi:hypothetical protein
LVQRAFSSNIHDSVLSKPIKQTPRSEFPGVFLKREELRSYASRILDGNGQRHSDIMHDLERSPVEDEMSPGSREAVEIVTRVARSGKERTPPRMKIHIKV